MAPVAAFTRRDGEYVIIHRCLTCGLERHNRIAADDDLELVRKLPRSDRFGDRARRGNGFADTA